MTKQQALQQFRELMRASEFDFRGDAIAKREAWNNYTDALCKDGEISQKQCDNWTNPF